MPHTPPLSEGCFGKTYHIQRLQTPNSLAMTGPDDEKVNGYCNFALCVEQGKVTQAVGWFNMDSLDGEGFSQKGNMTSILCNEWKCAMPMEDTSPSALFGPGKPSPCQYPLGASIACGPSSDTVTFDFTTSTKNYTQYRYQLQLKATANAYIQAKVVAWMPGKQPGTTKKYTSGAVQHVFSVYDVFNKFTSLVADVKAVGAIEFKNAVGAVQQGSYDITFKVRKDSGVIVSVSLVQLRVGNNENRIVDAGTAWVCRGLPCKITPSSSCDNPSECNGLELWFDGPPATSAAGQQVGFQIFQSGGSTRMYMYVKGKNKSEYSSRGSVTLKSWPDPPVEGYVCTSAGGCTGVLAYKGKCASGVCP